MPNKTKYVVHFNNGYSESYLADYDAWEDGLVRLYNIDKDGNLHTIMRCSISAVNHIDHIEY